MAILFLLLTNIISNASADAISFSKFLRGVEDHFPSLKIQKLKVDKQMAKSQAANGAFDSTFGLSGKKYLNGYYDSEFYEAKINKPLDLGYSNIAIGHRKSSAYLPVYYEEAATHEKGEFFVNFNTQLYRYREIDPRRYKRFVNKNKIKIEELNTSLKLMDVKVKASKVFWKWVSNCEKLLVYESLVKLNKKRFVAIQERVKKKDLAKIYLVEGEQYLLSFQSELVKLKAENEILKSNLQFYYPQFKDDFFPAERLSNTTKIENIVYDLENIITQRPELKILETLYDNYELELKYSEQLLKPKVGLNIEVNQSSLNEDEKYGDEVIVGLKFEIPLETNLGEGEIVRTKSNQKIIKFEKKLLVSKLKNTINNLGHQAHGYLTNFDIVTKELTNAKKLQDAEWLKFNAGASNFFLVNNRDINYAKAQIKLIEIYTSFRKIAYELELWAKPSLI